MPRPPLCWPGHLRVGDGASRSPGGPSRVGSRARQRGSTRGRNMGYDRPVATGLPRVKPQVRPVADACAAPPRPGSSVGTSVRLKIGRSAVRPRPWPPHETAGQSGAELRFRVFPARACHHGLAEVRPLGPAVGVASGPARSGPQNDASEGGSVGYDVRLCSVSTPSPARSVMWADRPVIAMSSESSGPSTTGPCPWLQS